MKIFIIEPFVGPLPLRFGMSPQNVEAILGPPLELLPDAFGNRSELRTGISLGYAADDNTLMEVVFSPGAKVFFGDHDLFAADDVIAILRNYDDAPQLWVGFLIFPKLGIRLSGFHDEDESQKAIAVVRKRYWDEFAEDFVPFE